MSAVTSPPLRLAFIGMSGIGKSYWSEKLRADAGFRLIGCDDEIQKKLAAKYPGSGVELQNGVAAWMKSPWEEGHKDSEREYLELEETVTLSALSEAESSRQPIVIDTTGSIIYLKSSIIERLSRICTTVLFDHSPAQVDLLYQTFLKHPKPLIWGDSYIRRGDEPPEEAMARSFRELLLFREAQYRKLAKRVVPMEVHRNHTLGWEDLLAAAGVR